MKHEIKKGESLWKIAKKYYGSGSKWKEIYEANKDQIKNPDLILPNQTLIIPGASDSSSKKKPTSTQEKTVKVTPPKSTLKLEVAQPKLTTTKTETKKVTTPVKPKGTSKPAATKDTKPVTPPKRETTPKPKQEVLKKDTTQTAKTVVKPKPVDQKPDSTTKKVTPPVKPKAETPKPVDAPKRHTSNNGSYDGDDMSSRQYRLDLNKQIKKNGRDIVFRYKVYNTRDEAPFSYTPTITARTTLKPKTKTLATTTSAPKRDTGNNGSYDGYDMAGRQLRDVVDRANKYSLVFLTHRNRVTNSEPFSYEPVITPEMMLHKPEEKPAIPAPKPKTEADLRKERLLETLKTATGLDAIKAHKLLYNVVDPWMYVDKANHTMLIYADGNNETPMYEYPITVGKQHGDYGILALPNYAYKHQYPESWSTPAGIFTLRDWATKSAYGIRPNGQRAYKGNTDGEPYMQLNYESGRPTGTSIHAPITRYRASLFRRMFTGESNVGNASMACISPEDNVMRQLYELNLFMPGDSVYINPEMEGNMIYHDMDNGQLKTQILIPQNIAAYGPKKYANRSPGTRIR